jgi:hypothetical protein
MNVVEYSKLEALQQEYRKLRELGDLELEYH